MPTKNHSTPFRKPALAASLAMLVLALISCNLPTLATATVPAQAPSASPSLTPLETATPVTPAVTPTSTITPQPSATATASPVNIVFSPGTTAAVEQGSLQPNQKQSYTLSAGQNQDMILLLYSDKKDAILGVTEPDGNVLLDPSKKWTSWQWLLPKTEVYTIQVIGGAIAGNFTLTAKVPKRVYFPSGSDTLALNGSTPNGYVFSYALTCQSGQTMKISLSVPASSATLDVIGLATGTLLSASAKVNSWSGKLPATQDYIIEVVPNNGNVVNYALTVTVK